MPLSCLIAIASVCLPWSASKMTIESNTLYRAAFVHSELGDVEVWYESDGVVTGPWWVASRACSRSACVDYLRQDNGLASTFQVRRADCDIARRIEIKPANAKARGALLAAVAVIPPHASAADAIPLSELSEHQRTPTREERMHPPARPGLACTD
jgi:hypothetical protein